MHFIAESNPSREFGLQRGDELLGDLIETVGIGMQLIGPIGGSEHALGIDQHKLFYQHNNRKELVTVNGGQVIQEALSSSTAS